MKKVTFNLPTFKDNIVDHTEIREAKASILEGIKENFRNFQ